MLLRHFHSIDWDVWRVRIVEASPQFANCLVELKLFCNSLIVWAARRTLSERWVFRARVQPQVLTSSGAEVHPSRF